MGVASFGRRGFVSRAFLDSDVSTKRFDSTTNPAFTAEELELQFRAAKPCLFFVQPEVLSTVREAATASGLQADRIILFNASHPTSNGSHPDNKDDAPLTVQDLVDTGLNSDTSSGFSEQVLGPEEGKTRTAILFPSSGTTGMCTPKFSSIELFLRTLAQVYRNSSRFLITLSSQTFFRPLFTTQEPARRQYPSPRGGINLETSPSQVTWSIRVCVIYH